MVENAAPADLLHPCGLIAGVIILCFPIWIAFVASTVTQPEASPSADAAAGRGRGHFIDNYTRL
jgi:sn-glycerol 3-phosphate transport system permease protein